MKRRVVVELDLKVTPWTKTAFWTPYRPIDTGAYRIWFASDGMRIWQCHQWEQINGNRSFDDDGWIETPFKSFPRNARDPLPGEEMPEWRRA